MVERRAHASRETPAPDRSPLPAGGRLAGSRGSAPGRLAPRPPDADSQAGGGAGAEAGPVVEVRAHASRETPAPDRSPVPDDSRLAGSGQHDGPEPRVGFRLSW
ncbi:hypothetical protein GCM10022215_00650 [Nocardioides fonticola]|uniref:Uncharacterized protein n=1 Tax=Nocardioides fonticola TaxID=450363 RepID=A0ABP7X8T5_9ACTN